MLIKRTQEWWDRFFLNIAREYSGASKDPSTQVGAVITEGHDFIKAGFNGFSPGLEDTTERYNDRTIKYNYINHAEISAIVLAARKLTGCTIYTYPFSPCSHCANQIILAGIKRVVSIPMSDDLEKRWGTDLELARCKFKEVGVQFNLVADWYQI